MTETCGDSVGTFTDDGIAQPLVWWRACAAAGAYQLTPWKRKCLECCRCPADHTGSFLSGTLNGLSCLGCCWALMLLLFVGGVMNLWWISALTILVLEKLTAH
jgi:predicted metal-binding membrane protein